MANRSFTPSKRTRLTPKQRVLKKWPNAELVRDGWDERAGVSGCFDFAIYTGDFGLSFAETPTLAWALAARNL